MRSTGSAAAALLAVLAAVWLYAATPERRLTGAWAWAHDDSPAATFTADGIVVLRDPTGLAPFDGQRYQYRIHASRSPVWIDIVDPGTRSAVARGIVQLRADGSARIALSPPGGERPSDFAAGRLLVRHDPDRVALAEEERRD